MVVITYIYSAPVIPTIHEEKVSTSSSLGSREDILSAASKEDLASDAEVKEISKREKQRKESVVHQFPSKFNEFEI